MSLFVFEASVIDQKANMKQALHRAEKKIGIRPVMRPTGASTSVYRGTLKLRDRTPQDLIKSAAMKAVSDTFGVDHELRAVIHHGDVAGSELDFIDYAVPCYELAKTLGINPVDLAKRLANVLRVNAYGLEAFKIQPVAGYVNFRVPDEIISDAINRTSVWMTSSHDETASSATIDRFVVLGSLLEGQEETALTDAALRYVSRTYESLGRKYTIYSLVADSSEVVLERVAHPLGLSFSPSKQLMSGLQLRRRIISAQFASVGDTMNGRGADHLPLVRLSQSHNQMPESGIAANVHAYLDAKASELGLSRDPLSRAVYLDNDDLSVALRSAEGFLYAFAYALYALDVLTENNNAPTVVLAPAKLQPMITALFSKVRRSSERHLTYFDPQTSRADILEIEADTQSMDDYFLTLANAITDVRPTALGDKRSRQAVLEVIDTPSELNDSVGRRHLPALFDIVNRSLQNRISLVH